MHRTRCGVAAVSQRRDRGGIGRRTPSGDRTRSARLATTLWGSHRTAGSCSRLRRRTRRRSSSLHWWARKRRGWGRCIRPWRCLLWGCQTSVLTGDGPFVLHEALRGNRAGSAARCGLGGDGNDSHQLVASFHARRPARNCSLQLFRRWEDDGPDAEEPQCVTDDQPAPHETSFAQDFQGLPVYAEAPSSWRCHHWRRRSDLIGLSVTTHQGSVTIPVCDEESPE